MQTHKNNDFVINMLSFKIEKYRCNFGIVFGSLYISLLSIAVPSNETLFLLFSLFSKYRNGICSFAALLMAGQLFAMPLSNMRDNPLLRLPQVTEQPVIDGKLEERVWREAVHITRFTQREPNEGEVATESTDVAITFDKNELFLGIQCYDTHPSGIVANEMRRDAQLDDNDHIEIYLDTFDDHRNAFFFATNALGAQWDGLIRNEGENLNYDWNGIWHCEAHIDSLGWAVEIAIPFKTLRFADADTLTWGINIARFITRKREEDFSTPILRDYGFLGKYKVSHFEHLTGLHHLTQGTGIQLKPFVTGGLEKDFESGNALEARREIGLDLKYSLTSNLTTDLTINTDFAQVEADQEQINLTRFDLFFPEKRDFFLEGADIFRFGERASFFNPTSILFFSRQIGLSEDGDVQIPIIAGARMTGKVGTTDVGVLDVLTDQKDFFNDDDEEIHQPRENFSVVRLKQAIFGQSSVGMLGVNKQSTSNEYNRTIGVDWNVYLAEQVQLGGFAAKTFNPGVDGNDGAGNVDFDYSSDLVGLSVQYMSIQDSFDAQVGYVPRSGIRKIRVNPFIAPRPGILNIRQTFFIDEFNYFSDQNGNLESRYNLLGAFTQFNDGGELFLGSNQTIEVLDEEFEIRDDADIPVGSYSFNNFVGNFESDKSRDFSVRIGGTAGDFYHGTIKGFQLGMRWKPTIHLKFDVQYERNNIALPIENGTFTTNLFSGRINYAFTTKLFSKLFMQWNDDNQNINMNFLFNYTYMPGSDLYIVYNEEWSAEGKPSVKNRTLLAKVTYLLNF